MLVNRNGKAKLLTEQELILLFKFGFLTARDRALFAMCLYTAVRISEARQTLYKDIFDNEEVRPEILIRKETTKGKQAARMVPTHPCLAYFLQKYRQDSIQLLKLKRTIGHWSHMNRNEEGMLCFNNLLQCPKCGSSHTIKHGTHYSGEQLYCCKGCNRFTRESEMLKNTTGPEVITFDNLGVTSSQGYSFLFEKPENPYLFTGRNGNGCLSLRNAITVFENAFQRVGIVGAGTHSCRRTTLTTLHALNIPLRVIQEISGHRDLGALQRYLEVSQKELESAVNVLE